MGWPLRIAAVQGPSMVPTLRHGDRVVIWLRPPRRTTIVGKVVVVELPERPLSIKRVSALDAAGRVQVEGDNAYASTDSRALGAVPIAAVRGVALLRLWPRPALLRKR